MKLYLIRHSITEGNRVKRYIGSTDQPLCEEGIRLIQERIKAGYYDFLYKRKMSLLASPMIRCLETLRLLFTDEPYEIVADFRECDFGLFENKNYKELTGDPEYQKWIDSGGKLPFPDGESVDGFNHRVSDAFRQVLKQCEGRGIQEACLVVHGGTIMAIMDAFTDTEESYYDFNVGNGEGYEIEVEDFAIKSYRKL